MRMPSLPKITYQIERREPSGSFKNPAFRANFLIDGKDVGRSTLFYPTPEGATEGAKKAIEWETGRTKRRENGLAILKKSGFQISSQDEKVTLQKDGIAFDLEIDEIEEPSIKVLGERWSKIKDGLKGFESVTSPFSSQVFASAKQIAPASEGYRGIIFSAMSSALRKQGKPPQTGD